MPNRGNHDPTGMTSQALPLILSAPGMRLLLGQHSQRFPLRLTLSGSSFLTARNIVSTRPVTGSNKQQALAGPMPRLLIKSSGASAQWIELKAGLNRLGRSPANDIQIHAATVSARHCEISVVDDSVTVRDCGSTNGTFIDHHPVSEAILLAGQVLQVGEIELV